MFSILFIFCQLSFAGKWSQNMQGLQSTLGELLPILSSEEKFANPKGKNAVKKSIAKLKKYSHNLKIMPDADPTLNWVKKGFSSELDRAQAAMNQGHHYYARSVLRTVTNYCVSCHTRSSKGIQFTNLNKIGLP